MIACSMSHLKARCRARGYTLDQVRPCIVSEDGDRIVVDETHQAYPRPKDPRHGPGTELKAMLKTIGIVATAGCSCNARARTMDERGCDWCESHIDEIDGWLAEEAGKRGLPYISLAGKTLIGLAIRRARKKGNK